MAKIPIKDFHIDSSDGKDPPSVYNPTCENKTTNANNNNNNISRPPSIREISDDQSDIQLDLAAPHLVRSAEICVGEIEVQTNIIRTLSVLSEQDKCCDMLADLSPRLGILLGPCPSTNATLAFSERRNSNAQTKPLGLLSRIGYILGNIMAKSDAARVLVGKNN